MKGFRYQHIPIPHVTVEEMKQVDRLMVEHYHIQLVQMMENVGAALAALTSHQIGSPIRKNIVVLAGLGNNGGGGLAAARRLACWGANVTVVHPYGTFQGIPSLQMQSVMQLNIRILSYSDRSQQAFIHQMMDSADLVIDALIGYGLTGRVQGLQKDLIDAAAGSSTDILSLDVPSGLHADSGKPDSSCIVAASTLTLALPKRGFLSDQARPFLGRLYVADISVPLELYKKLGITIEAFFVGLPFVQLDFP